jgi:hypothetical protein
VTNEDNHDIDFGCFNLGNLCYSMETEKTIILSDEEF